MVKKTEEAKVQKVVNENELSLMERLKLRDQSNKNPVAYPTTSVLKDMNNKEKEAMTNGTRKRRAESGSASRGSSSRKNLQRKKVAPKQVVKESKKALTYNESENEDMLSQMMAQRRINRQRKNAKIVVDSSSEED